MQQAQPQQAAFTPIHTQATRLLPGHGSGLDSQAVNDESYRDENSLLRLIFSVLANVIGGTLLLTGMFVLPHVIARILG